MSVAWLVFARSFRQSWKRFALLAAAISLGVAMVLVFLAAMHGLQARNAHQTWRSQLFAAIQQQQAPIHGIDPLIAATWVPGNLNQWQNQTIWITSLYATGSTSPHVPDIPTPQPGEYYVSPALDKLMHDHPEASLGARFGTRQLGVLPEKLATSPDSLDVIRGMSKTEVESGAIEREGSPLPRIYSLPSAANSTPGIGYVGIMKYVVILGIVILLFPVFLFISIAVQLGSAQREQRYAALRLIGATRAQIRGIIAVESLISGMVGIVLGSGIYAAARLWLTEFRLSDLRFWPADLTVSPYQYLLVTCATLAIAVMASWWGMRQVNASPLSVRLRSRPEKQPRWWRLIPLGVGFGTFATAYLLTKKDSVSNSTAELLIAAVLTIMIGIVLSGTWLTSGIARLAARLTRHAPVLLGAKRIATRPRQTFRAVSGVVVALFAGSFYLTAVSGMSDYTAASVQQNGYSRLHDNTAFISSSTLPDNFAETLHRQKYISAVTPVQQLRYSVSIMPCPVLSTYTARSCPGNNNQLFAAINLDAPATEQPGLGATIPEAIQNAGIDVGDGSQVVYDNSYFVSLTSTSAIDQLRSLVLANSRGLMANTQFVVSGTYAKQAIMPPEIRELSGITYVGIIVTMLIAIGSLLVSTIGGLLERQRSLFTLRLSGMTIKQLRQIVIIEALVPLVLTSVLSAAIGVAVGYMFMNMVSKSLDAVITPLYIWVVAGSLVAATLAIYSLLPILKRLTDLESNRTE